MTPQEPDSKGLSHQQGTDNSGFPSTALTVRLLTLSLLHNLHGPCEAVPVLQVNVS